MYTYTCPCNTQYNTHTCNALKFQNGSIIQVASHIDYISKDFNIIAVQKITVFHIG